MHRTTAGARRRELSSAAGRKGVGEGPTYGGEDGPACYIWGVRRCDRVNGFKVG
jgi:hypothetical protein